MRLKYNVIYVFFEPGRTDIAKIGMCSKGGFERFREGAFMNPRGLDVMAMWRVPDTDSARRWEGQAHKHFEMLPGADGKEWYRASPVDAVARITREFGRSPDFIGDSLPFSVFELYETDLYDELSEKGDRYKERLVRRRIWIHEERGGEFRKISQNTWWCEKGSRSTNAKRTTYNTRRMEPIACFALPVEESSPEWETLAVAANQETLAVYREIVERFGRKDQPAGRVGWTREKLDSLVEEITAMGFDSLALNPDRPPKGIKSLKFPGR